MTEIEAIEELKYDCNELGKAIPCDTSWGCSFENAYGVAIKALEEVQQYRVIGTPEECQKAVEKQIPQKPSNESLDGLNCFPICPNCHQGLSEDERERFCECGQRLDWSDVE